MINQQDFLQYYLEQAFACQRMGHIVQAQRLLEEALAISPEQPEIYNNLANLLMRQGVLGEALQYYARAVALKPDYLDAHFNLGLLFLKQANGEPAITQFQNVTRLCPQHISAHFYLANLYLNKDAYSEAIREFQFVLQEEPFHIEAHNNLGVVYLKLGNYLEAIQSFSTILRIDETHWEARYNLAAILLQQKRYPEASRQYEELLKFRPDDLESLYNLGVALMPQGRLDQAIVCFESILQKKPDFWDAHMNLAAALVKLGRRELAITHYKLVLQHQPDHPFVAYSLQALTGEDKPLTAPYAYIQQLFDNYADYFDVHMTDLLQYKTPEQLRQLLIETTGIQPVAQWRVLDLGCGTGLSGAVFRDFASDLIGVDLSPKMLTVARDKNTYDELSETNLLDFLTMQQPVSFDLIIAADVFVYTGDLQPVFRACRARLNSGGYFLFSTESCPEDGYILQKTARYAHSKLYIEDLANQTGWILMVSKKTILRQQDNQRLEGNLYLLKRI